MGDIIVLYYFLDNEIERMITYKTPDIVRSMHFNGLEIAAADILE